MTASDSASVQITRPVGRFVGVGLLLMAGFTALWAAWVPYGLPDVAGAVIVTMFLTFSVVLVVNGVALLRLSTLMPLPTAEEMSGRGRTLRIGFGAIVAAEGLVIGSVCTVLAGEGEGDYFGPAIAMVVGLHFIPFAFLFRRRIDLYIGGWVALWAAVGVWMIATEFAGPPLATSVVAITTAIGTASYGSYLLRVARAFKPPVRRLSA